MSVSQSVSGATTAHDSRICQMTCYDNAFMPISPRRRGTNEKTDEPLWDRGELRDQYHSSAAAVPAANGRGGRNNGDDS